jgi:hypothetical protein
MLIKRTFLLFIVFFICILPVSASFLSDGAASGGRYRKFHSTMRATYYIDTASICPVRYDPPFYTIIGDYWTELYDSDGPVLVKYSCIFYYDFDSQTMQLLRRQGGAYDENGAFLFDMDADKSARVVYSPAIAKFSLRTMVGELFFFECYHMYFNKKLNADFQRSLYK